MCSIKLSSTGSTRRTGTLVGCASGLVALVVYLLTLAPTVSFWDCGEFITTNRYLLVGHPPGAPFYQLLAHLFTLTAASPERVALWSNLLSATAGGLTVSFLCWTLLRLMQLMQSYATTATPRLRSHHYVAACVGSLCYAFCDTAWFSTVESEVYSLSMLMASVVLWATLRWYDEATSATGARWLLFIALLLGLATCVHLLALLVIPTLILAMILLKVRLLRQGDHRRLILPALPAMALFFLLGLTPYLILPLRADNRLPLNEGNPSTVSSLINYVNRSQYEQAPLLYPRIWRHHGNDDYYAAYWCGHGTLTPEEATNYPFTVGDNLQYFASYQLQYMYLRYFMWNFAGRYNDRQGLSTLQNGQFVTGLPPLDRLLVGTAHWQPKESMLRDRQSHHVYFLLPLLLGLCGLVYQWRHHRVGFALVALLFLIAGIGLAIYLNMPCYQPRERDYAFVLSFYAFCLWIGLGSLSVCQWAIHLTAKRRRNTVPISHGISLTAIMLVPLLMLTSGYADHDRSHNRMAHDYAWNLLHSCQPNAILLTIGDNDTFPLWYLQLVEQVRTDVQIINLNLLSTQWYADQIAYQLHQRGLALLTPDPGNGNPQGSTAINQLLSNSEVLTNEQPATPIYLSRYAFDEYSDVFRHHTQLTGEAYRLTPYTDDTVDCDEFLHHLPDFHFTSGGSYIDPVALSFIRQHCQHILLLANNLLSVGDSTTALNVARQTLNDIPLGWIDDPRQAVALTHIIRHCGDHRTYQKYYHQLHVMLQGQLDYYATLPPAKQCYITYTLTPIEQAWHNLTTDTLCANR